MTASPRAFLADDASPVQPATPRSEPSAGHLFRKTCGLPQGSRVSADPFRVAAEFPAQWAAFLRETTGGNVRLIAQTYGCSERMARKWLAAEVGANADKLVIAFRRHPERALKHFAAE